MVAATAWVGTTDAVASDDAADSDVVFGYEDRDITESSGLVARGRMMFTVNDSGDGPYVYAVDSATGETAGKVTYSGDHVEDVEAVAPGSDDAVWVGDIGDNNEDRATLDLYRVPMPDPQRDREVDARRFGLVYPDGPHDAEALLGHPRTERAYVVSKGILGGTVYAAPASLEEAAPNRMVEVGRVPGLVTDGAFFPDGRHIVLRSYGSATVYTFPRLRQVGRFALPAQEQGEAVAVDGKGRVYIGTEGAYTDVLQIRLPEPVRVALGDQGSTQPPPASSAPSAEGADPASDRTSSEEGDGIWVAGGVLLVTLAGWLFLTVFRRRGPRRP